jgi:pimeloyl-ACP methyl ester carboxylesterase
LQHAELPQSKLHEITDAGHFVPQEKPDEVLELALKHLA